MSKEQGQKSAPLLQEDFLVVNPTASGLRVYSASDTKAQHFITEHEEHFSCDCSDFAEEETCQHIRAVLAKLSDEKRIENEERKAIQAEAKPQSKKKSKAAANVLPATMTLKRSVSPDGRIDSLSVEFSCPVDQIPSGEIANRAASMLKLQSDISATFLNKIKGRIADNANGKSNGNGDHQHSNGGTQAMMLNIGSIQGRYGPRLFICFDANGQFLKLFGTAEELAEAISASGYRYGSRDIAAGTKLNIPCKIITKPARDSRYTDIVRVLPQNGATNGQRR